MSRFAAMLFSCRTHHQAANESVRFSFGFHLVLGANFQTLLSIDEFSALMSYALSESERSFFVQSQLTGGALRKREREKVAKIERSLIRFCESNLEQVLGPQGERQPGVRRFSGSSAIAPLKALCDHFATAHNLLFAPISSPRSGLFVGNAGRQGWDLFFETGFGIGIFWDELERVFGIPGAFSVECPKHFYIHFRQDGTIEWSDYRSQLEKASSEPEPKESPASR
jgi:hypothetical protein